MEKQFIEELAERVFRSTEKLTLLSEEIKDGEYVIARYKDNTPCDQVGGFGYIDRETIRSIERFNLAEVEVHDNRTELTIKYKVSKIQEILTYQNIDPIMTRISTARAVVGCSLMAYIAGLIGDHLTNTGERASSVVGAERMLVFGPNITQRDAIYINIKGKSVKNYELLKSLHDAFLHVSLNDRSLFSKIQMEQHTRKVVEVVIHPDRYALNTFLDKHPELKFDILTYKIENLDVAKEVIDKYFEGDNALQFSDEMVNVMSEVVF